MTEKRNKRHEARAILAEALLSQRVENDDLVVADEILQEVAAKRARFNEQQRQKVLRSPLTMKRLQWLYYQQDCQAQQEAQADDVLSTAITAVNEAEFAVLRAAATGSEAQDEGFTIDSDAKHYSVHFLAPMRERYRVVVRCDKQWLDDLALGNRVLCLQTQDGQLIVSEQPDEYGQMSGYWQLPESPRAYLSQAGHRLQLVVREKDDL